MSVSRRQPHKLTPFAKVGSTTITYPIVTPQTTSRVKPACRPTFPKRAAAKRPSPHT